MDPNEITKHIPEVVSVAKVAAASIPFTSIVKRMLGPAADEVAEMWRDQVRMYRYERQVKLLEKVERIAKEAGFTPQAVPPKILFPLLEGASFEDNESLHDMWAALLANAADPRQDDAVHPSYIDLLKQLSPKDAQFLAAIYDPNVLPDVNWDHLSKLYASIDTVEKDSQEPFHMAVDNMMRLRMLNVGYFGGLGGTLSIPGRTKFGARFVKACGSPTASAPSTASAD